MAGASAAAAQLRVRGASADEHGAMIHNLVSSQPANVSRGCEMFSAVLAEASVGSATRLSTLSSTAISRPPRPELLETSGKLLPQFIHMTDNTETAPLHEVPSWETLRRLHEVTLPSSLITERAPISMPPLSATNLTF